MNLNKTIIKCQKCNLYKNQLPLLDEIKKSDIMWLGLSAKKVSDVLTGYPLENNTNSGKLIEEIENQLPHVTFYKSNLVKCLPLNDNLKIRYPNKSEMTKCINNLLMEIDIVKPKVVFLLGNIVADFVIKYIDENNISLNTKFIKINHPSYICVYKRKEKDNYILSIVDIIKRELNL